MCTCIRIYSVWPVAASRIRFAVCITTNVAGLQHKMQTHITDALVLSTSETSNEDNRIITHTHTHTHMGMPQKASNFNTVA